jgi:2-polyprenyl-3-methyl-5-hydroxy-6-metoxy-1,4-benzoquinol methylase
VSAETAEAGGNVYDKYGTSNPVARRLMAGFMGQLDELVERTGATDAHEVGCGEGELSLALARDGFAIRGSDISAEVVAEAQERARTAGLDVAYRAAPIEALEPAADAAELVVCCEVLEHLPDPEAGLEKITSLASPWLIVRSLLKSQFPMRLTTGMLSGSDSRMPRTRSFSSSRSTISLMAGTG